MTGLWLWLAAWGVLALGIVLGWVAAVGLHRDTCTHLQDDAYDQGWDASTLHRTGLLRATSWADSRRTSEPAQSAGRWLAAVRDWARRHPGVGAADSGPGRTFPADYCLADSAGYGACVMPPHDTGQHQDANGHTWTDGGQDAAGGQLDQEAHQGAQPSPGTATWPSCPNCGGTLAQDAAGVYCPAGCSDTLLGAYAPPAASQAPPQALQPGCHSCADTDAGLVCQTQLGGVCPALAASRVAAQDTPGRHARARSWHRPRLRLRRAGAHP
jgi:hypothetical protein